MRGRKYATEEDRIAARRESQRRYLARHPERRKASLDAWWKKLRADPERYAKSLAQSRESYARNPITGYLYALNWRAKNRERVRSNRRAVGERRRIRVVAATKGEINGYAVVLRRDPCSYCGSPGGVIDHIEALAEGGIHDADNLTGACRSCNARKRTRPLLHFMLAKAAG